MGSTSSVRSAMSVRFSRILAAPDRLPASAAPCAAAVGVSLLDVARAIFLAGESDGMF